jgi:hypothetical protein
MHIATLMLLGAGELGREFAIAAKRLGCRLIACDRYENAPAMQVADAFEVFAMLDGKESASRPTRSTAMAAGRCRRSCRPRSTTTRRWSSRRSASVRSRPRGRRVEAA